MRLQYKRIDIFGDKKNQNKKTFLEDEYRYPYIVRYKKHWWSFWHYIMEDLGEPYHLKVPRLFFGEFNREEVLEYL